MEHTEKKPFQLSRCEAVGNRIINNMMEDLEKQDLAADDRNLIIQDVASFLLAMAVSQYQRPARKKVENLFINLMHLKLSAFDEAREHLKEMH